MSESIETFLINLALLGVVASPLMAGLWQWLSDARPTWRYNTAGAMSALVCTGVLLLLPTQELASGDASGLLAEIDALTLYFLLAATVVAVPAAWVMDNLLRENRAAGRWFKGSFSVFLAAMLLALVVANIFWVWATLELMTVASAILIRHRQDRRAHRAVTKYLVLTMTGAAIAGLGTLMMLLAWPDTAPSDIKWSTLHEHAALLDPDLTAIGFTLILIGYGIKAGFAPLNWWLPDAHSEAPGPVSALLSGVSLNVALYVILRFYSVTNQVVGNTTFTSLLFMITGLITVLLVLPPILSSQTKFKRVLAYSSVEHIGIVALGLSLGSDGAVFAALLHAFNHGLAKSLTFLAYDSISYVYHPYRDPARNDDDQIRGVLRAMPLSGVLLTVGVMALAGSPPFNIFLSEFAILWNLAQHVQQAKAIGSAAALVILGSVVLLVYIGLIIHLGRLLLDAPPPQLQQRTPAVQRSDSMRRLWPLAALALLLLIMGLTLPAIGHFSLNTLLQQSTCLTISGTTSCL